MTESILITDSDGIRTITLNRPDKLNSFNEEMNKALYAAMEDSSAAGARAILLTGAGRAFCAGQDLSDRVTPTDGSPPDLSQTLDTLYNPLIRLIKAQPIPIVCAVNGVAAGAGANLALTCDIVLAARSAKFIQAFAKIGLLPDSGGTWTLPRLVGDARARGLALLGDPLPADMAAEWGLIWKAVDDDALMTEAQAIAATLAEGPTVGYGFIKQALDASEHNTIDAQLDLERDLQGRAGRTPDYAEGVRAFMEKRKPNFSGRP